MFIIEQVSGALSPMFEAMICCEAAKMIRQYGVSDFASVLVACQGR